jgi:hypothetical protein
MGGDFARTGAPLRSWAGVKWVCTAQVAAAGPKPWPGSEMISVEATLPSGSTTTRMVTVCSSICAVSASLGQGQDQLSSWSETRVDRSGAASWGPGAAWGSMSEVGTAIGLVPVAAVRPPA